MSHEKKYQFCWKCRGAEASINCKNCLRSFHWKCLKNKSHAAQGGYGICPVCETSRASEGTDCEVLYLLPVMLNRIWKDHSFDVLKEPLRAIYSKAIGYIANPVDLIKIKSKANLYTSFDALIADIQWMYHNYWILYTMLGSYELPESLQNMKIVEDLIGYIKEEVKSMTKCYDCYFNINTHVNWFEMVCKRPHCVVWAKVEGHPYWPAKVMSLNNNQVEVCFFGGHEYANVPANRCFLYSEVNPDKARRKSTSSDKFTASVANLMAAAIRETKSYIRNFEVNFGEFVLAKMKTSFDPTKLDEYIWQMMNRNGCGANDSRAHSNDVTLRNDQSIGRNVATTGDGSQNTTDWPEETNQEVLVDLTDCNSPIWTQQITKKPVVPNTAHVVEKVAAESPSKSILKRGNVIALKTYDASSKKSRSVHFSPPPAEEQIIEDTIKISDTDKSITDASVSSYDWSTFDETVTSMKKTLEDRTDLLKEKMQKERTLRNDLRMAKKTHRNEVNELNERIEKMKTKAKRVELEHQEQLKIKDEECRRAVDNATKELEEKYKIIIEETKGKMYCVSCGAGKEPETFYSCSKACHVRYCATQFNQSIEK